MKYTKDDLAKMSDFEINKALAELLGYETESFSLSGAGSICSISKDDEFMRLPNYCSGWNDIMPLAVEYGIHFGPDGDIDNPTNHYAISDKSIASENLVEVVHSVPQRAIACCLILVLQERE